MEIVMRNDEKEYKGRKGISLVLESATVAYCNCNNPKTISSSDGEEFEKRTVAILINKKDEEKTKRLFLNAIEQSKLKGVKLPFYKDKEENLVLTGDSLGNVNCKNVIKKGAVVDAIYKVYLDTTPFETKDGKKFKAALKLRPTWVQLLKEAPLSPKESDEIDLNVTVYNGSDNNEF